jgi:hypothetical protein
MRKDDDIGVSGGTACGLDVRGRVMGEVRERAVDDGPASGALLPFRRRRKMCVAERHIDLFEGVAEAVTTVGLAWPVVGTHVRGRQHRAQVVIQAEQAQAATTNCWFDGLHIEHRDGELLVRGAASSRCATTRGAPSRPFVSDQRFDDRLPRNVSHVPGPACPHLSNELAVVNRMRQPCCNRSGVRRHDKAVVSVAHELQRLARVGAGEDGFSALEGLNRDVAEVFVPGNETDEQRIGVQIEEGLGRSPARRSESGNPPRRAFSALVRLRRCPVTSSGTLRFRCL